MVDSDVRSTYGGGTMDLKVQADGSGGLEELKDEFMDGRSVRSLPSFVLLGFVCESGQGLIYMRRLRLGCIQDPVRFHSNHG